MKLREIAVTDIANYFENCNYDGIFRVETDNDPVFGDFLKFYRFDGEYDDEDVFVFSVYKDNRGDLIVSTEVNESPLNFGEGWIEDEDNVSMEDIASMLLTFAKSGICENVDFLKRQIEFINDFGKQCKLGISSVTTATGNKYE